MCKEKSKAKQKSSSWMFPRHGENDTFLGHKWKLWFARCNTGVLKGYFVERVCQFRKTGITSPKRAGEKVH